MAKAKKTVKKAAKKAVRKFSKGEAFKFGWGAVKKNFWFFTGTALLGLIIMGIFSSFGDDKCGGSSMFFSLLNQFVVTPFIMLGFMNIALKTVNKKKTEVKDLFAGAPWLLKYVLFSIISNILIACGLVLLIIPGIWIAMRIMFAPNIIVDKGYGPIVALKKSWGITKGSAWQLFLLNIMFMLAVIAGFAALLVGFLVALPVVVLADMYVYKKLMK